MHEMSVSILSCFHTQSRRTVYHQNLLFIKNRRKKLLNKWTLRVCVFAFCGINMTVPRRFFVGFNLYCRHVVRVPRRRAGLGSGTQGPPRRNHELDSAQTYQSPAFGHRITGNYFFIHSVTKLSQFRADIKSSHIVWFFFTFSEILEPFQ